jgi:acyl-CoA dehydrogenase
MDDAEFDEIRQSVRRFVRENVVPCEAQIERDDAVPESIRAAAAAMGLYGFALPAEFGGLGLSMEREALLVIELGYTSPAFRSMFGTNNGIAGHVLMEGGTDEQQARFLPKLAAGEWTASFALTEADAGSDPSRLATLARRDGDHYVLNGSKRFITNAPTADVFMLFAKIAGEQRQQRGISCFMVTRDTAGLTVGAKDAKMGQAGAWTADVYLNDVRVPQDNLIGGVEGRGYSVALRCLAHGRLHIAALCVGAARRLVEESAGYALLREQFGHPIAEFQLIQALIADSQTDLMAAEALVLASARSFDEGTDKRLGPSCAKYFASEAVGRIADRAVQIFGGSGYMRGNVAERFYRDVRLFRLYEGTSQIQQLIIAKEVLARLATAAG